MDFTHIKQLLTDEDAVSPVIGVILMVAITVILAAVIGTFVLGLGENVQDSAPQANFQFEYGGDFSTDTGYLNITHTGGEDINPDTLSVQTADKTTTSADWTADTGWDSTVSTGSTLDLAETGVTGTGDVDIGNGNGPGDTIRVIWTSPSGGQSQTIGQSKIPA